MPSLIKSQNLARKYLEIYCTQPKAWNAKFVTEPPQKKPHFIHSENTLECLVNQSNQFTLANKIADLIDNNYPNCFHRQCLPAHVTGSAFVLNASQTHTVLVLHKKLGLWLQPGGHSDGEPDTEKVAFRELSEETGLSMAKLHKLEGNDGIFRDSLPFDCDIHEIPRYKTTPAHFHFDLRFLYTVPNGETLSISKESSDIRWVKLEEINNYSTDPSLLRLVSKALLLCNKST